MIGVEDRWHPFAEPVHEFDGSWYFWDETWSSRIGPFLTEDRARNMLEEYCKYIGGCGIN